MAPSDSQPCHDPKPAADPFKVGDLVEVFGWDREGLEGWAFGVVTMVYHPSTREPRYRVASTTSEPWMEWVDAKLVRPRTEQP